MNHDEIESAPLVCHAQQQVMSGLGFTLKEHTHTLRHVTWYREHCIIEIDPARDLTPAQAAGAIITAASNQALDEFTGDFRRLMIRRR